AQELLFTIGLNHKTAPLEAREKLYIHDNEIPELLGLLRRTLSECVILSTCNRTEIYGVCNAWDVDLDFYKDLLIEFKNAGDVVKREHFFTFVSCAACQQLFSVATSVDSKIIGDTQILRQLRAAYHTAKDLDATGRILNQLSQRALKIGKKVYTETEIHKGAVSVSLAAVSLARDIFGSLKDKRILIIGAGETAELTAKCLFKRRVGKVFFTNRTNENAGKLLTELRKNHKFEGEVVRFEDVKNRLNEFDIVISSTGSPEPILHKKDFANQTNNILLLDIAMPRDIALEAAENKRVILKNIDDLNQFVDQNYELRMKNLPGVKKIIMKEMGEFLMWYYSLPLMPVFRKTYTKPDRETIGEILKIKSFLMENVSELHKLAMQSKGNGTDDLQNHIALVKKLQALKREKFGEADA
ncbi:MAG TPA: glutamyl-tRNA reductase, partial [Pyrinomonadaceae bacterium]|nr:glutamyl-tRNA reductase [Pyrinomonadaceae bacterium]